MGDEDESFNLIAKMYEAHEKKLKQYEPLVGNAISQESFNRYKEKSLENCQKYSEKLLCASDENAQPVVSNRETVNMQLAACESTISDLQMELLFNKSLIDNLIKQKVDKECAKLQSNQVPNFPNNYYPNMTATATPQYMQQQYSNNVYINPNYGNNVGNKRPHTAISGAVNGLPNNSPWLNQPPPQHHLPPVPQIKAPMSAAVTT